MIGPFEVGGVAAALAAAANSGLLLALVEKRSTPAAIAREVGLDATATDRVLAILAAMGLASCEDGEYSGSPVLKEFNRLHPGGLKGALKLWSQAPAFLAKGERLARMDGTTGDREGAYKDVVSDLTPLFEQAARRLAEILGAPAGRILDVGAGAGVWSLEQAAADPEARVTALDLPEVVRSFEAHARERGLEDRVDTLPGDYHEVRMPAEAFDRVLLAHVLHLETPEGARSLVKRAAAAVAPGGQLVVVDILTDGTPDADLGVAAYGLHLALRTDQGRAHPRPEIEAWLAEAGLQSPEMHALDPRMPAVAALVASKPGS